jgi:hypothetical protein
MLNKFFSDMNKRRVTKRFVGEHVDRKGSDENVFSAHYVGLQR